MIGNDWDNVLTPIYNGDYFEPLLKRVQHEYSVHTVYPNKKEVFNALRLTPFKDVKVVIVGQDPYHGEGEAHGLSFSVRDGVRIPPSLKNIYKELYDDLGVPIRNTGDLTCWAKQGVLLLNSTLTVVKDTPNSHSNIGWQQFTDDVISYENVTSVFVGSIIKSKYPVAPGAMTSSLILVFPVNFGVIVEVRLLLFTMS